MIEVKLKANDSLMRAIMMMQFLTIKRCSNAAIRQQASDELGVFQFIE
jgi:hypothetical protein